MKPSMMVAGVVAALTFAIPTALLAHAKLTKSEPAANAHVASAPPQLRLWFSEDPEVAFTQVSLFDPTGRPIKLGAPQKGASSAEIRSVIPTKLGPGRYLVKWKTAAHDGHPTAGTFQFVVGNTK